VRTSLGAFARWMLLVTSHSGLGHLMSQLKQLGEDARLSFITKAKPTPFLRGMLKRLPKWCGSPLGLDQLGRLPRACPPGNDWVRKKVLREHKALLTTPHDTPAELLLWTRQHVAKFAKKRLDRPFEEFLASSPAATLNRGRKAGGAREEVRASWWSWLVEAGYPTEEYEDILDYAPRDQVAMVLEKMAAPLAARAAAKNLKPCPANRRGEGREVQAP